MNKKDKVSDLKFKMVHENFNVADLDRSLRFYEEAHRLHEKMGCICFENPAMGIYFIEDPDGYWLEIIPER